MIRAFFAALALLASASLSAAELRPFDAQSPKTIKQALAGKPFVLVFWSLYCAPCREEMAQWGALQRKYPNVPIVLVSTDSIQERRTVESFLGRYELGRVQTWIFADEFAERLRYAIDPSWRGELPRTYFFDSSHRAEARSGLTGAKQLETWITRRAARPGKGG